METGYILLIISIVIIYLPALTVGWSKAARQEKERLQSEQMFWTNASNAGGVWVNDKLNPSAQFYVDQQNCYNRALALSNAYNFKAKIKVFFSVLKRAITLQIILIIGWFAVQMMFTYMGH